MSTSSERYKPHLTPNQIAEQRREVLKLRDSKATQLMWDIHRHLHGLGKRSHDVITARQPARAGIPEMGVWEMVQRDSHGEVLTRRLVRHGTRTSDTIVSYEEESDHEIVRWDMYGDKLTTPVKIRQITPPQYALAGTTLNEEPEVKPTRKRKRKEVVIDHSTVLGQFHRAIIEVQKGVFAELDSEYFLRLFELDGPEPDGKSFLDRFLVGFEPELRAQLADETKLRIRAKYFMPPARDLNDLIEMASSGEMSVQALDLLSSFADLTAAQLTRENQTCPMAQDLALKFIDEGWGELFYSPEVLEMILSMPEPTKDRLFTGKSVKKDTA